VVPGVIVWSSAATSRGHEICNLDPLGPPVTSFKGAKSTVPVAISLIAHPTVVVNNEFQ